MWFAARTNRDKRVADLAGDLGLLGVLVVGGEEVGVGDHAALTGGEGLHGIIPLHVGPVRRTALADHPTHASVYFTERGSWRLAFELVVELAPLAVGVRLQAADEAGAHSPRVGVPRATMPGIPVFFFTCRAASAISSMS